MDGKLGIVKPLVDLTNGFIGNHDPNIISYDEFETIEDLFLLLSDLQNHNTNYSRFANYSQQELNELNKSVTNKNTKKRNKWANKIFESWRKERLDYVNSNICDLSDDALCQLMTKFIHEVRKSNGERYPGRSLVSIVAGIQSHISLTRKVDFFRDEKFSAVTVSLDSSMRISTESGASLKSKSADVISENEEKILWNHAMGILAEFPV